MVHPARSGLAPMAAALWLFTTIVIAPAGASVLPAGFQETTVVSGRVSPTAVRFAANGTMFVAQKNGEVFVYDSVNDTTATRVIDLRSSVFNGWDRGLLGLAVAPGYPADPSIYVLYSHDAYADGTGPRWNDACPTPPGPNGDGCVIYGRLSRVDIDLATLQGTEHVLLQSNWCQQYPSHSIGDLFFGRDGYLYVSAGEGASYQWADWGQDGNPVNPCGDPPDGVGGPNNTTSAEGGALRSQDIVTPLDATSYDGAILRIDVGSGAAVAPAGNPLVGNNIPDDDFIVAMGLRNPFRITRRPGTDEIWIGDVGWTNWEEVNVVTSPTGNVENFGWPCYEGGSGVNNQMSSYAGQLLCQRLYTNTNVPANVVLKPSFYGYQHSAKVTASEICRTGSSAISGIAFNNNANNYPPAYDNALYFADSSRRCIWAVLADPNGNPNAANRVALVQNDNTSSTDKGPRVVDLQSGPGGNLYYVDLEGGRVVRLDYFSANQPPTALISATPTNGPAPLAVQFSAAASSDPEDGSNLQYAWDLDGDGAFDDSTVVAPSWTYGVAGNVTVGLEVRDSGGATAVASVVISAGNSAPQAAIAAPDTLVTWGVGQAISFSGSATDTQEGTLPASALNWQVIMHHCYSATDCHTHNMAMFFGVASGTFVAPDHEYPAYLEFRLTATDSGGLSSTTSVTISPRPVDIALSSIPSGLSLTMGADTRAAPFTKTVIVGSNNQVTAPSPQSLGGISYVFHNWSDGGAQTHPFSAPSTPLSLVASYQRPPVVAITSPANGSRPSPGTITISASASDPDGSIARVQFYVGSTLLFTDTAAPWQASWSATYGNHVLKAVATDNSGASTTSASVTVRVKRR